MKDNKETAMNEEKKKSGGLHAGHRERMRKRFVSGVPDNFEDHEILEMLLFYAIPRQNTNEMAHELLSRFHSLRGVLDASEDELTLVPGVGNSSYVLFMLFREIMRRYSAEPSNKKEKFDMTEKIGSYFLNKYVGVTSEVVYMMLLDNSFRLIECKRMFDGSLNSAAFDVRTLINYANSRRAANVVIAHNHPNGIAVPSSDDMNTTLMISSSFDMIGINLLEHILVANGKYLALVKMYSDQGLFGRFSQII